MRLILSLLLLAPVGCRTRSDSSTRTTQPDLKKVEPPATAPASQPASRPAPGPASRPASRPVRPPLLPTGSLPSRAIDKVFRRRAKRLGRCWAGAKRVKVVVSLTIDPKGVTRAVKVEQTSGALSERVRSCLVKRIARWRFPRPRGGAVEIKRPL